MTPAPLISLLLLILPPLYPSLQTLWETDAPFSTEILAEPVSNMAVLSDRELARRVDFLQTSPDSTVRSRIALSLAYSGNRNVFSGLETAYISEKDPRVRTDILRAILRVPIAPPGSRGKDYPHAIAARWEISCLPQLKNSLSSEDAHERSAAARVLILAGIPGSDAFQRWLKTEKEPFVLRAVHAYAEKRGLLLPAAGADPLVSAPTDPLKSFRSKTTAQLVAGLRTSTESARRFSAEALAERGLKILPEKVFEAEKINPEGVLLLIGVSGNRTYAKRAAEFLNGGLRPESGQVAAAAIRTLGKLGAEAYLKQLLLLETAERPEVRIALAETLAGIKHPDAVAAMEKLTRDYDESVVLAAYGAIRRNPRSIYLPCLARNLKDGGHQTLISRIECLRALSAVDTLPANTVKTLEKLILNKQKMPTDQKEYEPPVMRALALLTLRIHNREPAASMAWEKSLQALSKSKPKESDFLPPSLAEYVRQIRLYSPGKPPLPAPLPNTDMTYVIRSL